jgi:hypothetical protein
MTFSSTASNKNHLTDLNVAKLSKISIATSLFAIVGFTVFQNLIWMQASHPAELSAVQKQALTGKCELKTVK